MTRPLRLGVLPPGILPLGIIAPLLSMRSGGHAARERRDGDAALRIFDPCDLRNLKP